MEPNDRETLTDAIFCFLFLFSFFFFFHIFFHIFAHNTV